MLFGYYSRTKCLAMGSESSAECRASSQITKIFGGAYSIILNPTKCFAQFSNMFFRLSKTLTEGKTPHSADI